jgi:hypothetical protein
MRRVTSPECRFSPARGPRRNRQRNASEAPRWAGRGHASAAYRYWSAAASCSLIAAANWERVVI